MTDIRTLADDEKIAEPGFYNISLDRHHDQPCDGPSVTSGVLRKMETATPADVWAFSKLNPDRWEDKDRPALWLGRAMAAYVEGGMDAVAKDFLILPEDKPNRPTAQQIKAYEEGRATDKGKASVEFWAEADADDRTPLTDAEITMIQNMGAALAADVGAAAAMGGIPEITMAVQDAETGLWLLARPDTVNFDGLSTDYKKMSSRGEPFNYRVVDRAITKFHYHMQGAFACEVFEALTGEWPSFGIIAQSDAPPHHVILREIADEELRIGQFQNRRAIRRFAECLENGYWPGPGEDVGCYQMPDWLRTRLLDEMQIEGCAP